MKTHKITEKQKMYIQIIMVHFKYYSCLWNYLQIYLQSEEE